MKNFGEQWKALTNRKEEDDPDTPKISKALPVIKWVETFRDHLNRCIGVRNIPLTYVVRSDVVVPAAVPALEAGQPYSTLYGSIDGDLISRASHAHGLYRDDNATVYYKMEEATRGTPYADSIKPFQRRKDGRGALEAMESQYAGQDKWDAEIKKMDTLLHTRRWKGQSNFLLEKFVQQHRNAFVSMQACTEHVEYQLPNGHTRVGYFLDALESQHPPLLAAMANIEEDNGPNGKRNNFENAVAYILPKDPVLKRKSNESNKRTQAQISDTNATGFGTKSGIGKTGVHLRWHDKPEYKTLNKDQRKELWQWRKDMEDKGIDVGGKNPNKKSKKAMAAAIDRKVDEHLAAKEKEKEQQLSTDESIRKYIMSLIGNAPAPKTPTGQIQAATVAPPMDSLTAKAQAKVTLQSIMKKSKH